MKNYYKKYEPIFGSWYITENIGQGAYGQVYLIERREMGVIYQSALKAITIPQDKNEIKSIMSDGMTEVEVTDYYKTLVQNIVNEFILMSKLKGNSYIVSYEDHILVEHEDDIGWDVLIRMELLTPLVEHIAHAIMDEREVIKLGIDLCKALEFCRKYNIIHRDIKPENIFIAPSGDYKLGDFGVSKTVEKTKIGLSRKGTYIYMAPEVYSGKPYGETVDIYSLGVVMYKLLNNNRTPFMPEYPLPVTYDDREEAFAKRIKGEKIPSPKNGSEELKRIVLKACSYHSEERFHSAEEMRKALELLFFKEYEASKKKEVVATKKEEKVKKEKGKRKANPKCKRIAAAVIVVLLAISGLAYAMIPKVPQNIIGIDAEETIYIGDTLRPEYQIEPDKFANENISFETGDAEIVSVDAAGAITATGVGEATVTLSVAGYKQKTTIKVIPKVTEISNVAESISVTKGFEEQIKPKLAPKEFEDEKITYIIKDTSIASVDKNGVITGKKVGSTTLTVSAGGCDLIVKIKVKEYIAPKQSAPATYNNNSNNNSSNKSKSTKSSSSDSDNGYFSSSDDEYF